MPEDPMKAKLRAWVDSIQVEEIPGEFRSSGLLGFAVTVPAPEWWGSDTEGHFPRCVEQEASEYMSEAWHTFDDALKAGIKKEIAVYVLNRMIPSKA